ETGTCSNTKCNPVQKIPASNRRLGFIFHCELALIELSLSITDVLPALANRHEPSVSLEMSS
ncbi:MAG: hypothetical protein QF916_08705, partial [Gammaproteobacteria bacterium]|nr:hypothetical protein [Gammaproteobacteria bacterium]